MAFVPFLRAQLSSRMPQVVNEREEIALELDRFTEYVTDPRPEHRAKLDELAVRIIKSNSVGNDPIFEVRVEGHADIARRIPAGAERKKFEDEVAQERAEKGLEFLVAAIARKGGDPLARRIARGSRAFGMGTKQLKIPNASTLPEFEANQRVVIIIRLVTIIPAPPGPPPPASSVIEDRYTVRLIRTTSGSIGIPGTHVLEGVGITAVLEITDRIDKKKARFNASAAGGGVGGGPTPVGGSATNSPGPEVPFKTFRITAGKNRTFVDLNSFVGSVTIFVNYGVGAATQNKGGNLSFSFDALESAGVNTQPQVIEVPGGSGTISVPSITGFTVLPVGRMTMMGTPTSL